MASAQVALKVSPAELQVIDAALRLYAHVMNAKHHKAPTSALLTGYTVTIFLHTWDAHVRAARDLLRTIGLK